jgi:hypothetical protein
MATVDYADGRGANGASAGAPARRNGSKGSNGRGANSPVSPRRLRALERQGQAMELRLAGKSFPEIGAELGVSKQAAYKLVTAAREARKDEIATREDDSRATWVERLEATVRVIWPKCMAGDLSAIDRLIKLNERHAKMCGLDLQRDVNVNVANGFCIIPAGATDEQIAAIPEGVTVIDSRAPWERAGHKDPDEIEGEIAESAPAGGTALAVASPPPIIYGGDVPITPVSPPTAAGTSPPPPAPPVSSSPPPSADPGASDDPADRGLV